MRNTNKSINLIREIDYDGSINAKGLQHLQSWVATNRNHVSDEYQNELIELVEEILKEKYLSDENRKRITFIVENHLNDYKDDITRLHELNGIIKRLFVDGKFAEKELYNLKAWMFLNKQYLKYDISNQELDNELRKLVKQDCVNAEKIEYIGSLAIQTINELPFETKLKYLESQVRKKKNIGIDLIDVLDNKEFIDRIHEKAEKQLRQALFSWSGQCIRDSEIVFISLVLIAIFEYDGSFYDGVRKTYSDLYYKFSDQKIEGLIRSVLNRYRPNYKDIKINRTRIINIALSNAVVPQYFLPDFFEFVYDIYKLNLDYDLPDNLYEEFKFVYEGIRSNMLSQGDDLRLNVTNKTYKLIKTTKDLIITDIDSLIRLSIMISKLIDKRVWNKPVKIYNPYFRYGYDEWNLKFEEDLQKKRESSQFRSRWEPKHELKGERIYLVPPVHKVKAKYNYYDIQVLIFNGDELVYENSNPDIREIIGGYKVSVDDIKLDNPLGDISYKLMAKDEVIYDSNEKLYRDFIVFDIEGKEIKNNTDYKGTAIFCYNGKHDRLNAHYRDENYNLASMNVEYEDVIIFGETVFNFSALIHPGIFGEQYDNCFVSDESTGKTITVYKKVDFLVFECEEKLSPNRIVINELEYNISDFTITITERQGRKKYVIDLELDKPDIYIVSVPGVDKFEIAYDPNLSTDELKIDDETYVVSISTELSNKVLNKDIDVKTCSDMGLGFLNKGKNYNYYVDFDFDIYRLSGQSWQPLSEDMWIGDVSQDSTLEIFGTKYDKMIIYSDTGQKIQELELKKKGVSREVRIGSIVTYKSSCKYLLLSLLSGELITMGIYCYNSCVINEDETEIVFDPVDKKLSVKTAYYGRGKVFFEISDDSNTIYKSDYLKNGEVKVIEELDSFVNYNIRFYEKAKGLSLKNNTLIKEYHDVFYAYDDFVGRYFKINEVYYNQSVRGEFLEKTHIFNKNYVYFKERVDESTFIGEIYVKTWTTQFPLTQINPVSIEICSDILDESIEIYMIKEGDGLLIDFNHHGIMNSMDDLNAPDIFSYVIDIRGVNEL